MSQVYDTDSVRDSVLRVDGSRSHPPLAPVRRLGQPGAHMEIHAIMTVDTHKLLSGDDNGVVSKWDIETGQQELRLLEHSLGVRALARLDSNTFASGSIDTSIRLWDMRAQRDSAGVLEGQCDGVRKMCVLDGSENLLVSAGDCTLKVWDLRMFKLVRDLDGCAPMALLDSKHIVSSYPDLPQSVRVWPASSFVKACDIEAHMGSIQGLDSNGTCLYSIAADNLLKIWHKT